jgi:hypothetical protein
LRLIIPQANSKHFQYGILLVIIANTAVLAIDNPYLSPRSKKVLDTFNDVFTWIFVFEVVVKVWLCFASISDSS